MGCHGVMQRLMGRADAGVLQAQGEGEHGAHVAEGVRGQLPQVPGPPLLLLQAGVKEGAQKHSFPQPLSHNVLASLAAFSMQGTLAAPLPEPCINGRREELPSLRLCLTACCAAC